MAEHGDLQRLTGSNPAVGVREAVRWYWYDARPGQRIWTCIDPFDQFGINDSAEPPRINADGRLIQPSTDAAAPDFVGMPVGTNVGRTNRDCPENGGKPPIRGGGRTRART